MKASKGTVYDYMVQSIRKDGEQTDSLGLSELAGIFKKWGGHIDHYSDVASTIFDSGESLFCYGNEAACIGSLATAAYKYNHEVISAIELPVEKNTNNGGTGRADLWLHTGMVDFYIEGKLKRSPKKLSQLGTMLVGKKGEGGSRGLLSLGVADFKKSAKVSVRLSKKSRIGSGRVMLLMGRLDHEDYAYSLADVVDALVDIYKTPNIPIYTDQNSVDSDHQFKPREYEHVILVMIPNGENEMIGNQNYGFIAAATIMQPPR